MSLYSKGDNVGHLPVATSASNLIRNVSTWFFAMLVTCYLENGCEVVLDIEGLEHQTNVFFTSIEYQIGDRKQPRGSLHVTVQMENASREPNGDIAAITLRSIWTATTA